MHSFSLPALALAAIAAVPAVNAHGYVSGIVAGGKWYPGSNPNWFYQSTKPQTAGWFAKNQDNGFVAPDAYGTSDIACHKSATPGNQIISVAAGSKLELQWNTWPDSHHGPVIDYLARCNGACTSETAGDLTFFKVDQEGVDNPSPEPGTWATDKLIANNFTWTMTVPSGLSGDFVLRHEIIALHSANNPDGAQNYPQCINLKITGSGTEMPCNSGAACAKGTGLYTETGSGIVFNIYTTFTSYPIPGPKIWSGLKKRIAMAFTA